MAISVLLNSGIQQSNSLSTTTASQSTQSSDPAAYARAKQDFYTPTNPISSSSTPTWVNTGTSTSQSTEDLGEQGGADNVGSFALTTTYSNPAVLPQAVETAVSNTTTPDQQAWSTLTQSMASGNLSSAQSALSAYTQALSTSTLYISPLTTPSAQFMSDLTKLGSALQSGNLGAAQSAFQSAQSAQPDNVAGAMGTAMGMINQDEEQALIGMANGSAPSAASLTKLSTDMALWDSANMEASANISNYLQTQGYSATAATSYANSMTNSVLSVSESAEINGSQVVSITASSELIQQDSVNAAAVGSAHGAAVAANATASLYAAIDVNATVATVSSHGTVTTATADQNSQTHLTAHAAALAATATSADGNTTASIAASAVKVSGSATENSSSSLSVSNGSHTKNVATASTATTAINASSNSSTASVTNANGSSATVSNSSASASESTVASTATVATTSAVHHHHHHDWPEEGTSSQSASVQSSSDTGSISSSNKIPAWWERSAQPDSILTQATLTSALDIATTTATQQINSLLEASTKSNDSASNG